MPKQFYSSHNSTLPDKVCLVKPTTSNWYALYTRSRCEKKVFEYLNKAGYTAFLPLVGETRRWSDRLKRLSVPLLPGYVFVQTIPSEISRVLGFPGVVHCVKFEGKPGVVRESEIQLLKTVIFHGFPIELSRDCRIGDKVRIIHGPLSGWEGKVYRNQCAGKVQFYLESLGQLISVEVACNNLELIP